MESSRTKWVPGVMVCLSHLAPTILLSPFSHDSPIYPKYLAVGLWIFLHLSVVRRSFTDDLMMMGPNSSLCVKQNFFRNPFMHLVLQVIFVFFFLNIIILLPSFHLLSLPPHTICIYFLLGSAFHLKKKNSHFFLFSKYLNIFIKIKHMDVL